jgi:phosphoribosylformylglycinamidine synthase
VDAAGSSTRKRIFSDLDIALTEVRTIDVYTIDKSLTAEQLERIRAEIFTDPLTQESAVGRPLAEDFDFAIEVGFLPGVTDNVGNTSRGAVEELLKVDFSEGENIYSSRQYLLKGALTIEQVNRIAGFLHNPLIQRVQVKSYREFKDADGMELIVPKVKLQASERVDEVELDIPDPELEKLGKEGILDHKSKDGREIRRGPLALSLNELHVIREHFRKLGRKPTDIELESLAQTWSEHCKHKIFAARLDDIDSIYRSFIKRATEEVRSRLGDKDWCVSVFKDNSGVVRFDENFLVCYKVETHNSPSALDPYGGAITGIVGVNRDPMGTGQGAKLVLNIYGFCFGNPYYKKQLPFRDRERKKPVLHPRVIFEGVRQGVEHGGNKSGIPTPWGFVIFDDRFMGKPLVFVGTVGVIPREINGIPGDYKKARAGDLIVMAGGRVGKDGIHGATFSSESLHQGSPAAAVQIGDPITQKKLHDAQIEMRDQRLYHSVTDNGAGGLSCSVGEMARESGGCEVELEKVPTKYAGLAPWEIWVSESQERMTYAVGPEQLDRFMAVLKKHEVEATVIGKFTDSGKCVVKFQGKTVMEVDLEFLHEGVPQLHLHSNWREPKFEEPEIPELKGEELKRQLLDMAGRLNLCSKEYVVRQYDHEVQGGNVLKPLVGVKNDVHGDAAVVRPVLSSWRGIALSTGILPSYGDIDPWAMAECGIDTAVRNVVAAGASPERIALLDNFCWCSSDEPERLGQLKRAAQACYETAKKYRTPFISGKDSMFNDFKGFDAQGWELKISVPPTILISSLGIVPDIRRCQTLDFKAEGDLIYVLGVTRAELGGSEYLAYLGEQTRGERFIGNAVPRVDLGMARARYQSVFQAISEEVFSAIHSVGVGGLGFGLAKMAMAGEMGAEVDLEMVPRDSDLKAAEIVFSESQSRFIVTVPPERSRKFEEIFGYEDFAIIGKVVSEPALIFKQGKAVLCRVPVSELKQNYKKTLGW